MGIDLSIFYTTLIWKLSTSQRLDETVEGLSAMLRSDLRSSEFLNFAVGKTSTPPL